MSKAQDCYFGGSGQRDVSCPDCGGYQTCKTCGGSSGGDEGPLICGECDGSGTCQRCVPLHEEKERRG